MSLSTQFLTMITMITGGFYLGLIQDTFRRFTPYWKNRRILTYVMEICFWLMQTMLLFYVLFRVNGGELRFYIFAACLLGFAFYQVAAANVYRKVLEQIIRIIAAVYRFFENIVQALIISPITWIVKLIYTFIVWLCKVVGTILLFILTVIITPIKWIIQAIYGLLPKKVQLFLFKIAGFYSKMKNICIKVVKYVRFKRR
ncbi:MAG: spore cortex biosynthesis protein YabQ [Bacillota bacterium]|uniref:Spore cortex biosynthesis protein YabQ n=1 Tax=Virgibacillus salarius TaxID=447199 RepID=A0A941IDY3_9BACI|nr:MULTISPECIES: spore cortex biosynthesis protein YabQ [Bacillaceae]MBR7797580.1 spore cortex biosynthesis protein YabQ [Virgibacillus salarius]NAZ10289.1 spore cortex biosynthesis protein YabQ [Agaribacter marinus]WBX81211.1 spore cortex biosynthesis protein YabQ [Virgibacillus salarius]